MATTTFIDNITLLGGAPYLPDGSFTSQVFDGEYETQWEKIFWEEDKQLPTTDIEIRTRTGNTTDPDPSWSGWSSPYTNAQGSVITSPPGRYIQYRANLSTNDVDFTPTLSEVTLVKTEYNLTFAYSIDAFENVTWARIFLSLNGEVLWEKVIDTTIPKETISFDIGRYLYNTGDTDIDIGLTVSSNTTKAVNLTGTVDDFQVKGPIGFYTSKIYDAGSEAIWREAIWDAEIYPTTDVFISIRTSLDNITWSAYSGPLAYARDNIDRPIGRYIQYRINFTTETLWLTPVFKEINITYDKYTTVGSVTFNNDLVIENVTNWGILTVSSNLRGQNISYEYSIDSGVNWNPLNGDHNLSSVSTSTNMIRFKAILMAENTSLTPGLLSLSLTYSVNQPPVIKNNVPNQSGEEDNGSWSIDLTSYESDFEDTGNMLRWYLTGEDTSLYTVDGEYSADDVLTFTPRPDAFGSDQVVLWLEDSFGAKTSQPLWVNITAVNDPPEIVGVIPSFEKWENDPNWQLDLSGYMYDKDNTPSELTWSLLNISTSLFDEVTVSQSDKIVTFDLAQDAYGNNEITVRLSDPDYVVSQKIWVNVTRVNKPPEINGIIPSFEKEEDAPSWVLDLTNNETDREDGSPSSDLEWHVLGLNPSLLSASISDNNITFSLLPNVWGNYEITIMLQDSEGLIDSQNIWVNVTPVNDAPEIDGKIPGFEKNENSDDWTIDLTDYKSDVDNSSSDLSWSVEGWDTSLFSDIDVNGNIITFVLKPDAYGNDLITINLTDKLLFDLQDIWVNVSPVNRAPVINGTIPSYTVNEDTPEWILDLTINETDREDGFPSKNLEWSVMGVNTSILSVSISDNNITFTPAPNAFGNNEITIVLKDSKGLTDTQNIWINITPENDAPVIYGIIPSFEKLEDAPSWTLNLSKYMYDVDNPSALTWEITEWNSSLFDLYIIEDEITFSPVSNAYGNYELTIYLNDTISSDSQKIWINITSVNDAPVINGTIPDFNCNEDDSSWTLDLTKNETDIEDCYPSQQLNWSVVGVDSNLLSVTIIDNNLTFELKPNEFGNNEITIILTDSGGLTDSQTIWVYVMPNNDPPQIIGVIPSYEKIEDALSWTLNLTNY
ncbi:MAG: hypothetical protein JSV56_13920, partial [Methanomassiliicoccales archaeon]